MGDGITYFPVAQLPKSMIRQRSLQKGNSGSPGVTSFLQMGHFMERTAVPYYRRKPLPASLR
jgi:hypothetical protein